MPTNMVEAILKSSYLESSDDGIDTPMNKQFTSKPIQPLRITALVICIHNATVIVTGNSNQKFPW